MISVVTPKVTVLLSTRQSWRRTSGYQFVPWNLSSLGLCSSTENTRKLLTWMVFLPTAWGTLSLRFNQVQHKWRLLLWKISNLILSFSSQKLGKKSSWMVDVSGLNPVIDTVATKTWSAMCGPKAAMKTQEIHATHTRVPRELHK